jgi:ubiquinone/menaquinone biosynthesis C-methylase UbiE
MNNMEIHVRAQYSEAARETVESLCCPVSYDREALARLPEEILRRDYGCGDPSRYVQEGDVVLDLGSGGGKICYMAAERVGKSGRVIGVDMNDDMLALARKYQKLMAERLGSDRVAFHKGRIQDLALDLERVAGHLRDHPVTDLESADAFEQWKTHQRRAFPLIPDDSVDLVISNCVLNLVNDQEKKQLFREIYRVTRPGGRVAISDIVSDAPVPDNMKADPELWSGCISGAFEENAFLEAFRAAGFTAVSFDKWDETPWKVIEGIEFRSVTVTAIKSPLARQTERGHAVIYRGPFATVIDDQGNPYPAGERIAVSEETFQRLSRMPFQDHFVLLAPQRPLLPTPFTLPPGTRRSVAVTRGGRMLQIQSGCAPSGRCC